VAFTEAAATAAIPGKRASEYQRLISLASSCWSSCQIDGQ
jgi:hypothetical protein